MRWIVIAALLVLWLLGLIGQVGGGLHWLLLPIAAVVFVLELRDAPRPPPERLHDG